MAQYCIEEAEYSQVFVLIESSIPVEAGNRQCGSQNRSLAGLNRIVFLAVE